MMNEQKRSDSGAPLTMRDRQREETRRKVFEASLEVFRRDGVSAARIDDIVKRAGVSRGTFYFHFPTKEDVLVELLRTSEERLIDSLDALPRDSSAGEVLACVARLMSENWQGDPALFPEVSLQALRLVSTGKLPERWLTLQRLAERFRILAEKGELTDALPPENLAAFLLTNIAAASLGWAANPELPLSEVMDRVSRLFLHGVGALPARA